MQLKDCSCGHLNGLCSGRRAGDSLHFYFWMDLEPNTHLGSKCFIRIKDTEACVHMVHSISLP